MHFYKFVDKGTQDPRCRNYYIYKCNICGKEQEFFWQKNFDKRNRKCPSCGVTDDVDEMGYYIMKKSELEGEIKRKQDELYAIVSKLQILSMTKEQSNVSIPSTV